MNLGNLVEVLITTPHQQANAWGGRLDPVYLQLDASLNN
jgi:hypothetical protein